MYPVPTSCHVGQQKSQGNWPSPCSHPGALLLTVSEATAHPDHICSPCCCQNKVLGTRASKQQVLYPVALKARRHEPHWAKSRVAGHFKDSDSCHPRVHAPHMPWLTGPSSVFKVSQYCPLMIHIPPACLCLPVSLSGCTWGSPSAVQGCDLTRFPRTTQQDLSISGHSHFPRPLSCRGQVPGIRRQAVSGRPCCLPPCHQTCPGTTVPQSP